MVLVLSGTGRERFFNFVSVCSGTGMVVLKPDPLSILISNTVVKSCGKDSPTDKGRELTAHNNGVSKREVERLAEVHGHEPPGLLS